MPVDRDGHDQSAFAAALLDPARAIPPGLGMCGVTRPQIGFAVYRNNVIVGLVDALQARFPVTLQLVGEAFFRAMAREFVRLHPPASPVLIEYGDALPAFIAAFEPARGVPYLADVARLEAAWSQAYHAADDRALEAVSVALPGPGELLTARLALHPSVRMLRSMYPIAGIWAAHQSSRDVGPPDDWHAEDVLVVRPAEEVRVHVLGPGGFAFISALHAGEPIAQAGERALQEYPGFDAGAQFVHLIRAGAITHIHTASTMEIDT